MTLVTSVQIKLDGTPLTPEQQRVLQSLEVEHGVNQQGVFKIRLGIGQDSSGDWAEGAESVFTPAKRITIEVSVGENRRRLINGLLTEFKMNFQADPCQSQLELVGMDVLEKLKRKTSKHSYASQNTRTIVTSLLQGSGITPPTSGVPDTGTPNPNRAIPMQTLNDLEYLRMLADTVNCEVYVEPVGDVDQGHFEPLDIEKAQSMPAIKVNQGTLTHARNASFFYDLSQATVVQAQVLDADGHATVLVKSDLRDKVSPRYKTLLGPTDFAKIEDLKGTGKEDQNELQKLCDAAIEKRAWVVVGKGELDSAAYGDALIPRRSVQVNGASRAFSDQPYLIWKVTHSFTRDSYCQKFELRRKLAVK